MHQLIHFCVQLCEHISKLNKHICNLINYIYLIRNVNIKIAIIVEDFLNIINLSFNKLKRFVRKQICLPGYLDADPIPPKVAKTHKGTKNLKTCFDFLSFLTRKNFNIVFAPILMNFSLHVSEYFKGKNIFLKIFFFAEIFFQFFFLGHRFFFSLNMFLNISANNLFCIVLQYINFFVI